MHADQPLSSIEAFALALVEASSRLNGTGVPNVGDASTVSPPGGDEATPAVE